MGEMKDGEMKDGDAGQPKDSLDSPEALDMEHDVDTSSDDGVMNGDAGQPDAGQPKTESVDSADAGQPKSESVDSDDGGQPKTDSLDSANGGEPKTDSLASAECIIHNGGPFTGAAVAGALDREHDDDAGSDDEVLSAGTGSGHSTDEEDGHNWRNAAATLCHRAQSPLRAYLATATEHFTLLNTPLEEEDTSPSARAEIEIADKFMAGGPVGEEGQQWVRGLLKRYGEYAGEIQSSYATKKRLLSLVPGRLKTVVVQLVGGGSFTWVCQDPLAIVARQLVDPVLMGHPGCVLEPRFKMVGGDTVVDHFMGGAQAVEMGDALRRELSTAAASLLRAQLVPVGVYLDGSHLDTRGNATALPLVLINELFSDQMYSEMPTLHEVVGYIPCWDDILPADRVAAWTSDDKV